jgi:FAD/FMN-containing dehydrogenase
VAQFNEKVLNQLREALDENGVREQADDLMPDIVLKPSSTEEVSRILEICDDVLGFFELGPIVLFDVSFAIECMQGFIDDIRAGMSRFDDGICVIFGHLGDGNLHVVLGNRNAGSFDNEGIQELLYSAVEKYAGSVSAEHGIGLSKREQLSRSRSNNELQLMMSLKKMLDPNNILNPNKIFSADKITAL